jgi:hypothetical protein
VVGVDSSTVCGVPEIGPKVGIGKGFHFFKTKFLKKEDILFLFPYCFFLPQKIEEK